MPKKIIAANWKLNLDLEQGSDLINAITSYSENNTLHDVEVLIAPPHTHLLTARELTVESKKVSIAAQDCSEHISGAYTGEVSAHTLHSMGVEAVIIGHSERRQYFGDTNERINLKIQQALEAGLTPIFCVGESLEDRKNNQQESVVEQQINEGLKGVDRTHIQDVVVAYEPVWAIGTGETASPEQAQEMHSHIRNLLAQNYNAAIAVDISILYGGSVKPANAKELFGQPDIDGGLIGGASLKADSFCELIKIGSEILR